MRMAASRLLEAVALGIVASARGADGIVVVAQVHRVRWPHFRFIVQGFVKLEGDNSWILQDRLLLICLLT